MYIEPIIEDEFFLPAFINPQSEREKAIEIRQQLGYSIDWLEQIASEENDNTKKSTILKEATAAKWERDRLTKEINKVTNE